MECAARTVRCPDQAEKMGTVDAVTVHSREWCRQRRF